MAVEILTDDGTVADDGEIGEVVVAGPTVGFGYLDRLGAERDTFRDGRLHTGDLGYRTEDGSFHIVGRRSERIIRDGAPVDPIRLDHLLEGHPDVAAAMIVPFRNKWVGEELAAYVVARSGVDLDADALLGWAAERVDRSACPRVVVISDEIPTTLTGARKRGLVAKMAWEELSDLGTERFA